MKRILILMVMMLCTTAFSEGINYDILLDKINMEISSQKQQVSLINKQLKLSPNDVQLHKELVYATTKLDSLNERCKKIKNAKSLFNKLTSENKKFDKMKVELLKLKEQSRQADEDIR